MRRATVLDVVANDETAFAVRVVYWFPVPVAHRPAYADARFVSEITRAGLDITAAERTKIRSGEVREEVVDIAAPKYNGVTALTSAQILANLRTLVEADYAVRAAKQPARAMTISLLGTTYTDETGWTIVNGG